MSSHRCSRYDVAPRSLKIDTKAAFRAAALAAEDAELAADVK